jgi:hypothetical protein
MEQLEQHGDTDRLGPDDVTHWISVYEELVDFLNLAAADLEPGSMRNDLEARVTAYRGRLMWWRQIQAGD